MSLSLTVICGGCLCHFVDYVCLGCLGKTGSLPYSLRLMWLCVNLFVESEGEIGSGIETRSRWSVPKITQTNWYHVTSHYHTLINLIDHWLSLISLLLHYHHIGPCPLSLSQSTDEPKARKMPDPVSQWRRVDTLAWQEVSMPGWIPVRE